MLLRGQGTLLEFVAKSWTVTVFAGFLGGFPYPNIYFLFEIHMGFAIKKPNLSNPYSTPNSFCAISWKCCHATSEKVPTQVMSRVKKIMWTIVCWYQTCTWEIQIIGGIHRGRALNLGFFTPLSPPPLQRHCYHKGCFNLSPFPPPLWLGMSSLDGPWHMLTTFIAILNFEGAHTKVMFHFFIVAMAMPTEVRPKHIAPTTNLLCCAVVSKANKL